MKRNGMRVWDIDGESIIMLLDSHERARLVDEYLSHLTPDEKDAILGDVFENDHRGHVRGFYNWLERRAREDDQLSEWVRTAEKQERQTATRRKTTDPDERG